MKAELRIFRPGMQNFCRKTGQFRPGTHPNEAADRQDTACCKDNCSAERSDFKAQPEPVANHKAGFQSDLHQQEMFLLRESIMWQYEIHQKATHAELKRDMLHSLKPHSDKG